MAIRKLHARADGRATVNATIEAARAREADERAAGLRATRAEYDANRELVVLELSNGALFGFPAQLVPGLEGATNEQRASLELSPSGAGIHWDALDVDYSVPGAIADLLGRGMAMGILGSAGGRSTSRAKANAARANGAKGGRPRKTQKVAAKRKR